MKKELSSAEQAEPYAKYFYQPIAPRPKEIMDTLLSIHLSQYKSSTATTCSSPAISPQKLGIV
jgi:hypothetical protein